MPRRVRFTYGMPNPRRAAGVSQAEATSIAEDVRDAALSAVEAVATAAAVRATTAMIPVAVMTQDYAAQSDDQRIAHDSPSDHTLTPLPPEQVVNRRFVFSNGYKGGRLTLTGQYVTATADGSAVVSNPVLIPGASVDVIARFVVDPAKSVSAPADLRVNGSDAPANTKGAFMYDIVAKNFGGPDAETFGQFSNAFQEFQMSYQPTTPQNAAVTKTAAYTCDVNDSAVLCDTTGGTFAVTLPTGAANGKEFDIKWTAGTAAPTVVAPAGGSITDGSPFTIPSLKATYTFQHAGSNVYIIV